MSRFRVGLAVIAGAATGGYLYYRYGLTNEDREKVKSTVSAARNVIEQIAAQVGPLVESVRQQPAQSTENRESTARQWTELGY